MEKRDINNIRDILKAKLKCIVLQAYLKYTMCILYLNI